MAEVKDNLLQLDKVVGDLNKRLDENIDKIDRLAVVYNKFSKESANAPSQYVNVLNDTKKAVDGVTKSTTDLTAIEKERIRIEKQLEQTTAKISIANEKNTQTLAAKKTELRALNSAYLQLSQREAESARRVQDLIARGKTATQTQRQYNEELRTAQREFDKYRAKVLEADKAVGRWNRTGERSIGFMRNLMGAFGVVGGVTLFATIARDIFQTTKELQSLDTALKQVSGSQEQFSRSQEFLRVVAEDFGIEINGLTKQFTQFYVSAKDKLSATQIEGIFRSISKAGSVMGLSVDSQNRAFTALNQMMSKGTIQAEELRGQLGEALPGAFGIMAKAMGTTEVGLAKLMKDGKLLANEVLPKFAEELEKVYGIQTIERVDTLASAQNRLSNEWTEFIRSLNEGSGVVSGFFKTIITEISETIKWWRKLNEATGNFKENFEKKTEQGFQQQLKALQNEADKTGVSLRNLAKVRQDLAVQERNDLYKNIKLRQERVNTLLSENPNSVLRGLSGVQDVIDSENKKIKELAKEYGYWNGVVKATNYILKNNKTNIEEVATATTGNTDATKKNTKAKKEQEIYQVGTVKWLNEQISKLKELNDTLSTSSDEYEVGVGAIKFYEQWLERLTGTAKKAKEELDGVSLDPSNDTPMTDIEGDRIKKEGDDLRAWYKDFRDSFQDDFWQNSGFSKIQFVIDNWDKLKESGVDTALAISEAFQEAFNTIANASQQNFDAEYSRLEQQKEVSMQFAGESAAAKEEIERQYETRKKEIQRREAEAQKRLAMFNIITNTAQAIMAAAPKVPLMIAMGAIGALQLAMVASQQIPQFWKGTDNAPEGLAWTQERGAEVITDSKGNVKTYGNNKGAQLTYLNKGDKVYKSHTDYINKELSKNGIQPIGQSFSNVNISNGLTKEDLSEEITRLSRTISQKENISINIDKKGFKTAVNGKNYINNRLILKGRSV
jgi:tape measure domain-containing protein